MGGVTHPSNWHSVGVHPLSPESSRAWGRAHSLWVCSSKCVAEAKGVCNGAEQMRTVLVMVLGGRALSKEGRSSRHYEGRQGTTAQIGVGFSLHQLMISKSVRPCLCMCMRLACTRVRVSGELETAALAR